MFPTVDTEDTTQVAQINSNTSNPSRNEQGSGENSSAPKQNSNRVISLKMLIKELIFSIALALTTYGALHNSPAKVSKHPQAAKFFKSESLVTDWYKGQLSQAENIINKADLSFVMYYAPWDAESQYVRHEFEKAAQILKDRVHFAAINCWNPDSECRLQHDKIAAWPILIVYTVPSFGIHYRGPRDAYSMVKFLEGVMKPLDRISIASDFVRLLSTCDAVAVGYTPLSKSSRQYNVWYNVAMKAKEFDAFGEICFAVILSEDLALNTDSVPSAKLMLWDGTKDFIVHENGTRSWNESSLIQWVMENVAQPVGRIIPSWKKSSSFKRYMDGNPLLILFTPLNPLYEQLPALSLLREVAMEYYNCKNNETEQWISELIKFQRAQRLLYQRKNYTKYCHNFKFKKPVKKPTFIHKKEIISRNNKYPWNNSSQKDEKSGFFNFVKQGLPITKSLKADNSMLFPLGLLEECNNKMLPAEKSYYDNYSQCKSTENKLEPDYEVTDEELETTMLPFEDDPLSPDNLIEDSVEHFCILQNFAYERNEPVFPVQVPTNNIAQVHGLACGRNFSMHMLAVDSIENYHFAEALGIDISSKKDKTAVIILDSRHETQYVLKEDFNAKSIREFIHNFTNNELKRTLRTRIDKPSYTHFFESGGGVVNTIAADEQNVTHIIDLTTKTFRRTVRAAGTVTLVGVCGGACGASVTAALTGAARLLAACGVPARAARLDALRHDLPWHLTAPLYPALFVFTPNGNGDADSVTYPTYAKISSSGLVALALRALGTPQHIRVRLALCARAKANVEKKSCLRDIRKTVVSVIDRNLKYWRRTDVRELKDALFKRLQHLHQTSLQLSLLHYTELKSYHKQTNLLYSLNNLSNSWDIDLGILSKNDNISTKS